LQSWLKCQLFQSLRKPFIFNIGLGTTYALNIGGTFKENKEKIHETMLKIVVLLVISVGDRGYYLARQREMSLLTLF
jgi:hypothetical protein